MADHRLAQSYPVAIATGVQLILGALVAAGWAKLPDSLITTIGTVVAAVVGVLAGVVAHSRVTPVTGGWAAQVRDLIRTALDDAVMQLLNSGDAAANTDAPPAAPSPSSSTSDVAAAGEPAVPRAARYTPPPTTPTPASTGRWVWTGETWSWSTDNAGPEATRGQRPGPGLPMPPQPGPARPGAPGPGVPPAPSARPGPR